MEKEKGKLMSSFGAVLDQKFKVSESGSSVSAEIISGVGAFLIAVCSILLNTQVIGQYYGNYAGSYFAIAFITFAATLVIGLYANKPVMQTANYGLSTLLIGYLGANTGLTYANVLVCMALAAVLNLVIVVTPLSKVFIEGLPEGVKKALPVGAGIYIISQVITKTGLINTDGTLVVASDLDELPKLIFWIMVVAIAVMIIYVAAGRRNALGSTYMLMIAAMWALGIIFFMEYFVGGQTATTLVYERVNLIVATDGASPYNIAVGIKSLKIGELFVSGFDFSAYTQAGGNVVKFIIQCTLTFLFFSLYAGLGNLRGAWAAGEMEDSDANTEKKVMLISAVANIFAAILGAAPTTIAGESAVETRDGGKTGLATLTASVGFLIALFTWLFFALTATTTNGVGMWISETETKLTAYVQDGFQFTSLIMIFAAAAMFKACKKIEFEKAEEVIALATVIVASAFLQNLIIGIAIGVMAEVIIRLFTDRKSIKPGTLILMVILIAYSLFTLNTGNNFITAVSNMMMMPMG